MRDQMNLPKAMGKAVEDLRQINRVLEAREQDYEVVRAYLKNAGHHFECTIGPDCKRCSCGLDRARDVMGPA